MQSFQFPLARALAVRATQLQRAEVEFQIAAATLAAAERERDALAAAESAAESGVRRPAVPGEELNALSDFRDRVRADRRLLLERRQQCIRGLEVRRRELLEARRRLRLLERLKERRFAEWKAEAAKELEAVASESFLAQWPRVQETKAGRK